MRLGRSWRGAVRDCEGMGSSLWLILFEVSFKCLCGCCVAAWPWLTNRFKSTLQQAGGRANRLWSWLAVHFDRLTVPSILVTLPSVWGRYQYWERNNGLGGGGEKRNANNTRSRGRKKTSTLTRKQRNKHLEPHSPTVSTRTEKLE